MTLTDIRAMPTVVEACVVDQVEGYRRRSRIHESCLRSYQCLEKVKELLEKDCPSVVILEIIADVQAATGVVKEIK